MGYRFLKHKDFKTYRPIEVEFSTIRHPKEERITNRTYAVAKGYVYGKTNDFLDIRFGTGVDKRLVEKSDPGSIAISISSIIGASLGFQKPIYYQIIYPLSPYSYELHDELFNPEHHSPDNIYGKSNFFKGFSDLKVKPGIYLKSAFCFDYGRKAFLFNRIETGAQIEVFLKRIELMAIAPNQQLFFSFFLSYRLGIGSPKNQHILKQ